MTNLIQTAKITTPEIEKAEQEIIDAQQRAADLLLAEESKRDTEKHLRARRNALATRLSKLEARNNDAARTFYSTIIRELLDTPQVEQEHARSLELKNAFKCLGELRTMDEELPPTIAAVKAELAKANALLAELAK